MTHTFYELVVGGVLVAPFLSYAVASLIVIVVIRPVLHLVGFSRIFSHPSVAELSLYVTVLGLLVLLF
jgi:Protein of unknown function (DUF1656)